MQFDAFLEIQLAKPGNHFLLMAEDHFQASGMVALANRMDTLTHSEKNIIIFSEGLAQQPGPYSLSTLPLAETKTDDAIAALVKAGVVVYGCETKTTDPFLFSKAQTKIELLNDLIDSGIPIFQSEEIKKKLINLVDLSEEECNFDALKLTAQLIYITTLDRITRPNQIFCEQMAEVMKTKENTLCIFVGGSTHLCEIKNAQGEMIEPGMQKMLSERFQNESVSVCFVNDTPSSETSYTPKTDNLGSYSSIEPRLLTESSLNTSIRPGYSKDRLFKTEKSSGEKDAGKKGDIPPPSKGPGCSLQ